MLQPKSSVDDEDDEPQHRLRVQEDIIRDRVVRWRLGRSFTMEEVGKKKSGDCYGDEEKTLKEEDKGSFKAREIGSTARSGTRTAKSSRRNQHHIIIVAVDRSLGSLRTLLKKS